MPSMDPTDASVVFGAVQTLLWERGVRGSKVATDASLLAECYAIAGEPAGALDADLRMVTVMSLLGPDRSGAPPQEQRDVLLDRILKPPTAADAPAVGDRILDYVVAWGCGQARATVGRPGSWEAIWAEARHCLCNHLDLAVRFADKWLKVRVVGLESECGPPPYFPGACEAIADLVTCDPAAIPFADGQVMEIRALENETEYMMSSQFWETVPAGGEVRFRTGPEGLRLPGRRVGALTEIVIEVHADQAVISIAGDTKPLILSTGQRIRVRGPFTLSRQRVPLNSHLEIRHTPAGAEFRILQLFQPIPAGARQRFRVREGAVEIRRPGEGAKLAPGAVVSLLAQDRGAEVRAPGVQWRPRVEDSILIAPCAPGAELASGCSCGLPDCEQIHRVQGWEPALAKTYSDLSFFVRVAVLGAPPAEDRQGEDKLNADEFTRAMYFQLLSRIGAESDSGFGRLRYDGIEEKVCSCGHGYYLGARCPRPECDLPFDGGLMRRNRRMRVILIVDPPLYRHAGRVHCSLKFDRLVPAGFPELTAHAMLCCDLGPEYACPRCHARLFDAATEAKYRSGAGLPKSVRIAACPACAMAMDKVFQRRAYACDNYYTISPSNLGLHASCVGLQRHVWLPVAVDGNRLAAALEVQRARRELPENAPCGHKLYAEAWCPVCRAHRVPLRSREIPEKATRTWIPVRARWVQLQLADTALHARGLDEDAPLDGDDDLDVAPDPEEES